MSKNFSKFIIVLLVISFLFVPFSDQVSAQNGGINGLNEENGPTWTSQGETMVLGTTEIKDVSASFTFIVNNVSDGYADNYKPLLVALFDKPFDYANSIDDDKDSSNFGELKNPVAPGINTLQTKTASIKQDGFGTVNDAGISVNDIPQEKTITFSGLTPNTKYFIVAYLINVNAVGWTTGPFDTLITVNLTFTTAPDQNTAGTVDSTGGSSYTQDSGPEFGCGTTLLSLVTSCIVSMVYYLIFIPLALLAGLAARILDFFVYYSTNSDSYTGPFVDKGWAVVRDIANIFFIVSLLYVAIRTILNIHVSNNKKVVGMIIMIALVINFSLFTTKIVIDATNILAKIFYNNINSVDESGKPIPPGTGKEKSVTLGLVKTFNPHQIFTKSKIDISQNLGKFFAVLVLSIILMVFMIKMFLSVAVLFVARVISLWLAMIFSPIAFASLTTDLDLKNWGWKGWKEDLFSSALLAPVFIFFLYIIILFGNIMTIGTYGGGNDGTLANVDDFNSYMQIFIPFVIIYALITKAKEIAVKMSGEMGKTLSGVVNTTAAAGIGLAGGFALGKVAQGLRGTLGSMGSAIERQGWTKKNGLGRAVGNAGRYLSKSSFDIRAAKVAGKDLSKTFGVDFGQAKKGGFVQANKERSERRIKRAENLKVKPNEAEALKVRGLKDELNSLVAEYAHDFDVMDTVTEKKRKEARDAKASLELLKSRKDNSTDGKRAVEAAQREAEDKQAAVDNLVREKKAAKGGTVTHEGEEKRGYFKKVRNGSTGKMEEVFVDEFKSLSTGHTKKFDEIVSENGNTIDKLGDELIPTAEHEVEHINRERINAYSRRIEGGWNRWTQRFTSLGQHSSREAREDAFKLRNGVKADHGGGHH